MERAMNELTATGLNRRKYPIKGYLFLVSTAFFTALSYVFAKLLQRDLNPETITFFWFFGAFFFAMFVVAFIPSQRAELKNLGSYKKIFILSSLVTSVGVALWIISIKTIGLPLTSFLMKTQTLFSLFLGMAFLGERLNRGEVLGVIITIIGGVVVAYQRDFGLLLGTATAVLSAFFYSFLAFLVKRIAQDLNMLTVANLRALGVSIVMFTYLMVSGRFMMPEFIDVIYMALGGLSGAYIAKASQFQSIKLLDVSRSTAVMPMESIFVVAFSYIFFDSLPSPVKLLGGAIILTGVVFLIIFRGEQDVMGK